jgi:arsenate reductase (thioredoxin)
VASATFEAFGDLASRWTGLWSRERLQIDAEHYVEPIQRRESGNDANRLDSLWVAGVVGGLPHVPSSDRCRAGVQMTGELLEPIVGVMASGGFSQGYPFLPGERASGCRERRKGTLFHCGDVIADSNRCVRQLGHGRDHIGPPMGSPDQWHHGCMGSVLFLCVHNAGRSQMAAGFMRQLSDGEVEVFSGGTEPAESVNPVAVAVMAEKGVDISDQEPEKWTDERLGAADVVVTMGCGDTCPVVPGKRYVEWVLDDPSGKPLEDVRAIRDEIETLAESLLAELAGSSEI